jgi:hypothetical protein
MGMPPRPRDPVRHALRYPFRAPGRSCVVIHSGTAPLGSGAVRELPRGSRTPLLAAGSNAAPAVLREKLGDALGTRGVPVVRAEARDLAVVHSAHFAAYGSVPATPVPCPGAVAGLYVLWLTAAQLLRLDGTESLGVNYRRAPLVGADLRLDGGGRLGACDAYLSLHGPLHLEGAPVALTAVHQTGVPWRRMDQRGVQEAALRHVGFGGTLDAFIRQHIADPSMRARHGAALKGGRG